jgi:hypothetical protein
MPRVEESGKRGETRFEMQPNILRFRTFEERLRRLADILVAVQE